MIWGEAMNKQIIEMAHIMQNGEFARNRGDLDCNEFHADVVVKVGLQRIAGAKALYNAGYRKALDVRSDTVRKMQEMLKETFEERGFFSYYTILENIDQIAKELLEEQE